ncbi:putative Membrane protein [Pseudomonas syringae pv. spinaceae]|uniref:Putative Membrane protein n=2 Tax=Pseudomonas syringae TaxID=317 RepID=A0A0Q0CJP6_PSESX|nr:putative Membrane protein [Pseudomonas syringae pv. spinaceae]
MRSAALRRRRTLWLTCCRTGARGEFSLCIVVLTSNRCALYCPIPGCCQSAQPLIIRIAAIAQSQEPRAEMKSISHIPRISKAEAVLILITMLWGGTFLLVQHALTVSGPMFFVGLRFAAAALIVALFSLKVLRGLTFLELKAGVFIGTAIMLGYGLQTVGLQTIPSSQSAFITALYVPCVPLLQWLVLGRRPGLMPTLGIILAFTGLMLVSGPQGATLNLSSGEIVTLISAVAIAAEIIMISAYAGKVDVRRVTVVQLATASILAFLMIVPTQERLPDFSWLLVVSAVGLGLMSAAIQIAMNWAQKSVSPTRATVIYAGEPVWAGLVGRLAGERLPGIALLGAALIVAGVIVSEMKRRSGAGEFVTGDEASLNEEGLRNVE